MSRWGTHQIARWGAAWPEVSPSRGPRRRRGQRRRPPSAERVLLVGLFRGPVRTLQIRLGPAAGHPSGGGRQPFCWRRRSGTAHCGGSGVVADSIQIFKDLSVREQALEIRMPKSVGRCRRASGLAAFTTARTLARGPNQASRRCKRTACPFVERGFDSPGLSDVKRRVRVVAGADGGPRRPRLAPHSQRVRAHCADTLLRASALLVPANGSSRLPCRSNMDTASALCASVD